MTFGTFQAYSCRFSECACRLFPRSVYEILHQHLYILLFPLAAGGKYFNRENVQTGKNKSALKVPAAMAAFKSTVGCGYDTNVGGKNSVTPTQFELP